MKGKTFLLVLSAMLFWIPRPENVPAAPMSGAATAWNADEPARDGEGPPGCGGSWFAPSGECTFQCRAGDVITIAGEAMSRSLAWIKITASCDGAEMVACEDHPDTFDRARCSAMSDVIEESGMGRCSVEGFQVGSYACKSVTPPE